MAGLWQALPAKPQVLHLIPKAMGKEGFEQARGGVSFTFYGLCDCYLKTDWRGLRLPLEKPGQALERGNPGKVVVCKIQISPSGFHLGG